MIMLLKKLYNKKLINLPKFILDNTHYLMITGSVAYGCSSDTTDNDIIGVCIPPKDMIFPHLTGEIPGFGTQIKRFENWQQHHIEDKEERKSYDFAVYSIVRYFQLCMENNPNMIDTLFVPINCILHVTQIGNMIRDNRRLFLHKGCWHKFRGYAYSQLHKIETKSPADGSKRNEVIKEHGYDTKFGYHLVRLLDEVEQILTEGDLDLQRSKEVLKSIRRGEWKVEDIKDYFDRKEKELEKLYIDSKLPYKPDEKKLKRLLLDCLEQHFGSLTTVLTKHSGYEVAMYKIADICNAYLET